MEICEPPKRSAAGATHLVDAHDDRLGARGHHDHHAAGPQRDHPLAPPDLQNLLGTFPEAADAILAGTAHPNAD
jgi:hypothetical protein